MMFKSIYTLTTVCLLVVSFNSNATLIGRDFDGDTSTIEAYYDDAANLTWLADANYAMTSGYDADGRMHWGEATSWVAGLDVEGVTGWRLATTSQPDLSCDLTNSLGANYGYDCTGSEMGNLFYNVLGNSAGALTNAGPFSNVYYVFWSDTEYAFNTIESAWRFNMDIGHQNFANKDFQNYSAWAVQSGDVGTAVVPVPAAVWLFGSGLIGLLSFGKRKKS